MQKAVQKESPTGLEGRGQEAAIVSGDSTPIIPTSDSIVNTPSTTHKHASRFLEENIPQELKDLRQWVCYRIVIREGKETKIPVNWNGGAEASSTDPGTWGSFSECLHAWQNYPHKFHGIGFVFSKSDPYIGIDLDKCIDETQTPEPWACEIISLVESYTERSQSGKGLHIIARGFKPGKRCRSGKVEMYDTDRFFVMTGDLYSPQNPELCSIQGAAGEVAKLYNQIFPESKKATGESSSSVKLKVIDLDDDELLNKARKAKNGEKFTALYDRGDISGYPSASEADESLCSMLAFWTQKDANRMEQLLRKSALHREKWENHPTYLRDTIQNAIEYVTDVYEPRRNGAGHIPANIDPSTGEIIEGLPEIYTLSDDGNALRFASQHGGDLCYSSAMGWLVWKPHEGRWIPDETDEVTRRARETARKIPDEARHATDDDYRGKILKHGAKSLSERSIRAMVSLSTSDPRIAAKSDDFDADPWLLNVANGTIDLRTGELREHRPGDLITKYVPIAYDPKAQCPRWLQFLDSIMLGNNNLTEFLQCAIGYSLTGDTREQCLFVLWGNGRNGKSVFLETVGKLVNDYGMAARPEMLMLRYGDSIPNDVARLKGARMVQMAETEQGRALAEVQVKELTGGDTITARFLRKEFFDFRPVCKFWIRTNHKPTIKGTDDGIWRRIRLIPFEASYTDDAQDPAFRRDPLMGEKLLAELPGILRWAVEGCLKWQQQGMGMPQEVMQATQEYRKEMDVLGAFFEEYCVIEEGATAPAGKLLDAHREWATANGEKILSGTAFGRAMNERGFNKYQESTGERRKMYKGLRLANDDPGYSIFDENT